MLAALRLFLLRALYGRRNPAGRRLWCGGFLAATLLPYALGAGALALIVAVVDPYDLRPWGLSPRLAEHVYPDSERPLLINVYTRSGADTVLVGASTVMGVTPDQMRRAFGPTIRPVNIAYPMADPSDTADTLRIVEGMPGLKRVIIVADHSLMLPMGVSAMPAKNRKSVLGSTWSHAGDFSVKTALASANRVVHGVYDQPQWAAMHRPAFVRARSMSQDPRDLRRLRRATERHRQRVLGGETPERCDAYPFLASVLEPSLRRLTVRGVKVEVVFPPYPLVSYYDWIDRRLVNDSLRPGPVFAPLMNFKWCLLKTTAKFGEFVSVTSVDNDTAITGNLDNWADTIHLLSEDSYQSLMDHIARGDARLTLENFAAFDSVLRKNVLAVEVPLVE